MRTVLLLTLLLFIYNCSSHPTISPIPLKPDEVYTGLTFSFENVVPVFVYRRGLTESSDFGVRIGLPFYGSGIDYSRVIYQKGNYTDIVNFAYSLNPNSNFDLTYYSVRTFPKKPENAFYNGFRIMYIPRGVLEGKSIRFGFLLGMMFNRNVLIEMGYFHDFDKGQPIEYLFKWKPMNDPKYPAITDYGFPSEYSRLTGISCQVGINLALFKRKDQK